MIIKSTDVKKEEECLGYIKCYLPEDLSFSGCAGLISIFTESPMIENIIEVHNIVWKLQWNFKNMFDFMYYCKLGVVLAIMHSTQD